jgi:hypothetical protein
MKAVLALVLAACTSGAQGIPGDTSPDDPTTTPDETTDGKADKTPVQIALGKGVVMDVPTVVHVYWGSYWTTDAGLADRAVLDAFTGMVGGASWWGLTAEYADSHGTAPGAPTQGAPVLVADDPPSKLYATDTQLHQFLSAQLTAGTLTYDAETVYIVIPAPGTNGPRGECGHHSYFSTSVDGARHKVIYSLVPYLGDDPSCGVGVDVNTKAQDQMTVTLSHEIAEAVTDPYLDAWTTPPDGVEIADQCDTGFAATWGAASFAVQDLWSNASSGCLHQ